MNEERTLETIDASMEAQEPAPDNAVPPELRQILRDLQSPDANTRARAVRALCPCRGVQWGVPVFHHVQKMLRDSSPIVRRAVRHDLHENPWWSARQEIRPEVGPPPRTVKVTLAIKGLPLGDLCDQLRADTGVPLFAAPGVARHRVTLFCERSPLRDVLQQLSRLLGCTWSWTRNKGIYRYELRQDPGPAAAGEPRHRPGQAPKRDQNVRSPVSHSGNALVDPRLAHDRTLRQRVTLQPAACQAPPAVATTPESAATESPAPTVTSADFLEAIHRATAMPIVADSSSRLCPLAEVTLRDQSLYVVLNQAAGAMGLCWQKDPDGWLQFRTLRRDI